MIKKSFILRDCPEPLIIEKYLKLFDKDFYLLPPQQRVVYHINLEYYFGLMNMDVEIGVEIYLRLDILSFFGE
jgi:hypothetical protein